MPDSVRKQIIRVLNGEKLDGLIACARMLPDETVSSKEDISYCSFINTYFGSSYSSVPIPDIFDFSTITCKSLISLLTSKHSTEFCYSTLGRAMYNAPVYDILTGWDKTMPDYLSPEVMEFLRECRNPKPVSATEFLQLCKILMKRDVRRSWQNSSKDRLNCLSRIAEKITRDSTPNQFLVLLQGVRNLGGTTAPLRERLCKSIAPVIVATNNTENWVGKFIEADSAKGVKESMVEEVCRCLGMEMDYLTVRANDPTKAIKVVQAMSSCNNFDEIRVPDTVKNLLSNNFNVQEKL